MTGEWEAFSCTELWFHQHFNVSREPFATWRLSLSRVVSSLV